MAPRVIVPMLGATGVLADLICWGRDGREWFALVAWAVYGNTPTGNAFLNQSAWVPAERLVRSADSGLAIAYRNVERLDLPPDRTRWPTPAAGRNRTWLHHGAVTEPLAMPSTELIHPIPTPLRSGVPGTSDLTSAHMAATSGPGGDLIRPMLATTGPVPGQPASPLRPEWAYEMKWDGVRAVLYLGADDVRIMSRNDRDVTVSYPELVGMAGHLASPGTVLDGEIVAFDGRGRPSFGRLQQRMHVGDPRAARQLSRDVPAVFLAFDLLRLGGQSLLEQGYADRRELLERLDIDTGHWQTPPVFAGSGADAMRASLDQNLEGVVAKRLDSTYRPGARSPDWRKVKNIKAQEVVIGGWRPGQGRRQDTIGSLLMGVPEAPGGRLTYVGHVGTGFSQAVLAQLSARLVALRTEQSPFTRPLPRPDARDAIWVRAAIVGEVAYTEWTADDRLRHPSWRGLRPDKDPENVVREA